MAETRDPAQVARDDQYDAAVDEARRTLTETLVRTTSAAGLDIAALVTPEGEERRSRVAGALLDLTEAGRVGSCDHLGDSPAPAYWNMAFGNLRAAWNAWRDGNEGEGENEGEDDEWALIVGCGPCLQAATRRWADEQKALVVAGGKEDETCDWCREVPADGVLLPHGVQLGPLTVLGALCRECQHIELRALGVDPGAHM